jgi:hypothetical protein
MMELIPDGSSQHGRFGDYIVTSMKYDSDAGTYVFTSISIGLLRSVLLRANLPYMRRIRDTVHATYL